jgi:hypothetical protein
MSSLNFNKKNCRFSSKRKELPFPSKQFIFILYPLSYSVILRQQEQVKCKQNVEQFVSSYCGFSSAKGYIVVMRSTFQLISQPEIGSPKMPRLITTISLGLIPNSIGWLGVDYSLWLGGLEVLA